MNKRFANKVISIIRNKVLFYLVSRYVTYFIQFVTSLIIATKLGPYYMGIWGFVLLIINIFQQCHFGIAYSLPVFYVHYKDDIKKINSYIGNSLFLICGLCLLVLLIYIYYLIFGVELFDKYQINELFIWICIIAALQYYQTFFLQLLRVKNKILSVAFCQSIVVFLNFVCIFFFTGIDLIYTLIAGNVIGLFACLIIAFVKLDIKDYIKIHFSIIIQRVILKKASFLFIYGACFYFIIISIRTIISIFYSVDEFGIFTFSFTVSHAVSLLLEAVTFLITPKILSKLSSVDLSVVCSTIQSYRQIMITSSHLLIYCLIILFPYFLIFFPKYKDAGTSLNLISLSMLMNSNVIGYAEYMIANNKEKILSLLSSSALVINCLLGLYLSAVLNVDFCYVILSTMFAYLVYSFSVTIYVEYFLFGNSIAHIFKNYFPIRLIIPYMLAVLLSFTSFESFLTVVPLLVFLAGNFKQICSLYNPVKEFLRRPEVVNI